MLVSFLQFFHVKMYQGYKAVMLFAKIRARSFPEQVFTLNYMPRVQELR